MIIIIEAVKMNCLSNICGLRRIDRVPNVDVNRSASVFQRMNQGLLR